MEQQHLPPKKQQGTDLGQMDDPGLVWAQGCPVSDPCAALPRSEELAELRSHPAGPEGNRLARTEYHPLIFLYQCLLFQCIRAEIFKAA